MLFKPLNSNGRKRSVAYHRARLAMLHDRVLHRIEKVDHAFDEVEQAAAAWVEATHQPTDAPRMPRATHLLGPEQTLGL